MNGIIFIGVLTPKVLIKRTANIDVYIEGEKINPAGFNSTPVGDTSQSISFLQKFVGKLAIIAVKSESLQFKICHDYYGELEIFKDFDKKLKQSFELYMQHLSQEGIQ